MQPAILFVDDDPRLLEFLRDLSADWNYQVFAVDSGAKALKVVASEDIQAAIVDQDMPEMDGTELLNRLKSEHPEIVRVMMTGYTDQQSAIDAINKGEVFRFVRKPFEIEQLLEIVKDSVLEYEIKRDRQQIIQRLEQLARGEDANSHWEDESAIGIIELVDLQGNIRSVNKIVETAFGNKNTRDNAQLMDYFGKDEFDIWWPQVMTNVQKSGICRIKRQLQTKAGKQLYDIIVIARPDNGSEKYISMLLIPRHLIDTSEYNIYKYILELENTSELKDRGLKFLYEMSKKMGTTHDMEELVQTIFSDLLDIIDFDISILTTFRDHHVNVFAHSSYTMDDSTKKSIIREIRDQYFGATSISLPEPQLDFKLKNYDGQLIEGETSDVPGAVKANITLPLENPDGEVIGIIYIGSCQKHTYTGEELRLFATFVNRIALVIHIIHNIFAFQVVQEMANKDGLTGLFNRRYFEEFMTNELDRAKRFNKDISLLMLDIDNFKQINDRFGHLNGDEILRKIASILASSIRSVDQAFRYGGEEFIIILPETNLQGADVIAERVRDRIQKQPFQLMGEIADDVPELEVTISIGVGSTSNPKNLTTEDLVGWSDKALYYAKQHGKNMVVNYNDIRVATE